MCPGTMVQMCARLMSACFYYLINYYVRFKYSLFSYIKITTCLPMQQQQQQQPNNNFPFPQWIDMYFAIIISKIGYMQRECLMLHMECVLRAPINSNKINLFTIVVVTLHIRSNRNISHSFMWLFSTLLLIRIWECLS